MKDKVDISIKDVDKLFGQIRVGVYSDKVSVLCKLNNYGFKKLVDDYNSIHSNKISLDDFTKGNYDMIIHYDFLNNYGPYYLQIDKTDNEKMWNILKNDCGKYNYKAWYQYAKCLSYKNDIQNEAEALCNVLKIFKEKWEEKILSPLEYKYLENIVLELEDISNKRLIYIDEKDLKEMKKLLDRDLTSEFKKCMGVK